LWMMNKIERIMRGREQPRLGEPHVHGLTIFSIFFKMALGKYVHTKFFWSKKVRSRNNICAFSAKKSLKMNAHTRLHSLMWPAFHASRWHSWEQ
jgi:hypothetical protein